MGQVLNDACEHARMATWHWICHVEPKVESMLSLIRDGREVLAYQLPAMHFLETGRQCLLSESYLHLK